MTALKTRSQYLIGYSAHRCDDPRGQFYNWTTMRAMIVRGDGVGHREVAPGLITKSNTWTQFAGWSPDGRNAFVHQAWESPENYAWERAHQAFRLDGGWMIDCCVVGPDTGKVENLTQVERVSNYNTGLFVWPSDPGRMGFTAIIRGESRPFSMNRDGTNKKDLSDGDDGFTYGYSASPDGKRISYHKSYQVYLADADGSNAKHIDTGAPFNFGPLWSPDGQWIVFLAGKHGDSHPHLIRADGAGLRKIADRGGYVGWTEVLDVPDFHSASSDVPCWSADSRWIYCTARVGEAVELMRVSIDGQSRQLTHSKPGTTHYHPEISPDSEWALFGSTRDGARALYVAGADGADIRPITTPTPGMACMHGLWQPVSNAGR